MPKRWKRLEIQPRGNGAIPKLRKSTRGILKPVSRSSGFESRRFVGMTAMRIKLHWGNAAAKPGSQGQKCFQRNPMASHRSGILGETLVDSTGAMDGKDTGTNTTPGTIGQGRLFSPNHGLTMGEKIEGLPAGSAPHTTEAWARIDRPNSTIVAWGNEKAQGKVVMQYRSPSRINMDCYFSGGISPPRERFRCIHGSMSYTPTRPRQPASTSTDNWSMKS
jgi:hypothetical protein